MEATHMATWKAISSNRVIKTGETAREAVYAHHSGSYLKVYRDGILVFDGNASTARLKIKNGAFEPNDQEPPEDNDYLSKAYRIANS
jgi:hypothetical protein